jgi:hypothetical protein
MSLSLQGNHHLPAGHVLQSAIGLDPVPPLAKNSGNVGAAKMPILVDKVLDIEEILAGNGSISDS